MPKIGLLDHFGMISKTHSEFSATDPASDSASE